MPLPDAKPSTRIYELLKTTDLENITFSQFQGVAEKIFAEQGAEDELRRIVLVNLARLSVVGEWTGLTSAGASNEFDLQLPGEDTNGGNNNMYIISRMPGWGVTSSSTGSLSSDQDPHFWPWISPKTGNLTILIDVTTDGTGVLGLAVYSDVNGAPYEKIGGDYSYTFGSTGTGLKTLTPTADVAVERGQQYWLGVVETTTGNGAIRNEYNLNSHVAAPAFPSLSNLQTAMFYGVRLEDSDNTLPAGPITATRFSSNNDGQPRWAAQFG